MIAYTLIWFADESVQTKILLFSDKREEREIEDYIAVNNILPLINEGVPLENIVLVKQGESKPYRFILKPVWITLEETMS